MGLFDDLLEEDNIQTTPKRNGLFDDLLEEDEDIVGQKQVPTNDFFAPRPLKTEQEEKEIGTLEGISNAAKNAFDSSRQAMDVVGGVTLEEAQNIAKIEFDKKSRKLAPGYDEYQKAEGMDAVWAFAKNPIEVTSNIIAEGLAGSLPALGAGLVTGGVAAAAAAPTVIGAPVAFTGGQIAGTFAGSLATEYGSKVLEELQGEGMDITDPNSIQTFFSNEELMGKVRDKALTRGVPVAAFDAISAGIGGKLGRVFGTKAITEGGKIIGKQFATKTGEAATELGVQAGLGAGGEVAGALVIGETPSVKAAFGEAIGEVGTGGIQVLTGRIADQRAMAKTREEAKIKATSELSTKLEENSAPLTANVVTAKSATNIEQDKLAAQLEEELTIQETAAAAAKPTTTYATQKIIQPESVRQEPQDGTQIGATTEAGVSDSLLGAEGSQEEGQVARDIVSELQAVSNNTATREQIARLSMDGLVDVRRGQAIINEDGEGILAQAQAQLPKLTPEERAAEVEATPVPKTREEVVSELEKREAGKDRLQELTSAGERLGEEGQILDDILGIAPNSKESENLSNQEKVTRLTPEQRIEYGNRLNALVSQRLTIATAPVEVTPVTPTPTEPTIGEIPQTSPMIGEQPTEPIISEKPATSDIVGAEPATIVEQEQVAPAEEPTPEVTPTPVRKYDIDSPEVRKGVEESNSVQFLNRKLARVEGEASVAEDAYNIAQSKLQEADKRMPNYQDYVRSEKRAKSVRDSAIKEVEKVRSELDEERVRKAPFVRLELNGAAAEAAALTTPSPAEAPAITPAPVAETPAVTEAPAADVAPATITRPAQEDVKVSRYRKFLGESAPQAISEAKNALSTFKTTMLGKRGDSPFQAEPRLRELKNVISLFVANRLNVTNQNADQIAEQIILGKPNIVDKVTELKPIKAKELDDIEANRSAIMRFGYELDDKKTYRHPREAEVIAATPAEEPAGISVGNRIKLGKSPQTYIVEEVVPQSEVEKANDEQFYSVKNERTGEVQVVEKADMKQVGGKKARKMAAEVIPKQESVTPIQEANRYTFEEAVKAVDAHFGKQGIPEGVVIVNNTTEPDLEMKAGYFVNRGQIVINLAYIAKGENLGDIIDHELGHYIFGDPEFQADFKQFWELMTPEEKADADRIISQFYNKETGAVQMEEKQIRAFMQLIQDSKAMPKWKQLLDKIKRWINEKLGTNLQVNDRGALAALAAAHKRFKSGEQIVREIDSGVLKSAETAQDAEYLAAVERGDMETAQRMVNEAAKPSTHTFIDASQTQSNKIRWTDSANNQIEFYKSQIAKLPSVEEATREYEALVKAWNDAGLGQSVEDTIKGIIELKLQPPPSSLDEYLQTRIYLERKNAEAEIKKSQETLSRAPKGKTETEFKTGRPTIVKAYHSTPFGRLTEFSDEMLGRFTGAPSATKAHFFAGSPSVSETYFADDAWLLNHKGFFSLSGEQKKQLIDSAREELQNGLDSRPDEIADLAMSLFDIDTYDTSPYENVKHDVYIRLNNPLVYDFKGAGYRDVSYNDLLVKAAEGGYDGVIMANTTDPGPASTLGSFPEPTNIIAVLRGHSSQIKSADPVTFDDAGNVIPLSQRFRATSPDIRRMAAEPRREQVGGEEREQSKYITTPKGILAKNTDVIRQKFFDGTKVSPENTTEAWGYIERLLDIKSGNANELAGIINDTIETELQAIMDADIAAGKEVDPTDDVNKRVGAAMFSVELMNYAGRLADQGDTKMLERLIRDINDMPVDNLAGGISEGARALRTRLEYDVSGFGAYTADQAGKVDRTAATLFGTGRPNKEQVKVVKEAIKASDKTEVGSAEEIAGEIENIEKRTKRKVISKIEDQISGNIEEKRKAALDKQKARPATPSSVERQAISVIDQLARIQSDTPAFTQKQENLVKAIVQQDLRQKPRMNRKEAWTSQLTAKLIQAGASETQALTISELVWRQHEIKAMDRDLKELQTAAEKGSLAVIIQRIKDTPLEDQQKPEWMQGVIRDYLVEAGLSEKAAVTAARLYESVIAERFAEAKQKAFEATLAKSAPWNNYLSRNAQLGKNALKKIQDAIRTGVLDPTQTTEGIIAKENGWSGFSKEQLTRIVQLDGVLSDENANQADKAEAMSELNKIIVKAKMPVRFKDAIGAYYVAQALMGIPTLLVNIVSPIGFSVRNMIADIGRYAFTEPSRIPMAFETFLDSMKSWYNQTSYAFKNQIYMNDVVEYLQGQNVLRELFDKGKAQWAKGDYANGMANMLVGMTQITGRVLSALDQGAISALENQNITRYAMEAMKQNNIPQNKRKEFANMILHFRRQTYMQNVSNGMASDRAGVLADLAVRTEIVSGLSSLGIRDKVLDSAINDALQTVGRNKTLNIDSLTETTKKLSDDGILSYLPISFLENIAEAAGRQGPAMQVFSKMLYGFALVPARVFHTTAWFSPYGFVRLAVDKYKKSKGYDSPYAMSLQTELQYKQRLTETIAGSIVMLGLAALAGSSTDDDDEKKFKIVITGNGPSYSADRQYYDAWHKKYKPYSVHIVMGDTIIPINIGRGGEALFFPIMLAGGLDDWKIKEKLNLAKKEPESLNLAAEVLGSAFFALAQRGPYAAFTKPLFDASKDGKITEELVGQAGFFGKTFVPILGSSLSRNISDFISDPVDRSSMQGAIYANTPIVGPWLGTKALNALGQPIRADDWGDKLFKLGVPAVFSFPKNTPENELNELILSKGSGPSIPTRSNAQKRFGDVLTDKEFEVYVREYGRVVSDKMFKNRKKLESLAVDKYDDELEKYVRGYSIDGIKVTGASDMAVRAVKRLRNE